MSKAASFSVSFNTLSVTESISLHLTYQRAFDDSFGLSDAPAMSVAKSPTDSIPMADAPTFSASTAQSDSYAMSDSPVTSVDKHSLTPSRWIRPYQSHEIRFLRFRFSAEQPTYRVPAHSTNITESHASTLSKALQDFFTLDDFSQIDKEAGAAKSNVYVMQDTPFDFNSSRSDAIIVQDSQAFTVSKPEADSIAVSDTQSLSPGKGISDSVSMGEAITVGRWQQAPSSTRAFWGLFC